MLAARGTGVMHVGFCSSAESRPSLCQLHCRFTTTQLLDVCVPATIGKVSLFLVALRISVAQQGPLLALGRRPPNHGALSATARSCSPEGDRPVMPGARGGSSGRVAARLRQ